jgi:hypothetical protein
LERTEDQADHLIREAPLPDLLDDATWRQELEALDQQ